MALKQVLYTKINLLKKMSPFNSPLFDSMCVLLVYDVMPNY